MGTIDILLGGNPVMDWHPVQGGVVILLGLLRAKEIGLSPGRLGLWLVCACTFLCIYLVKHTPCSLSCYLQSAIQMTNLRYGLYSPSEAFADYQLAIFHQCQVLAQYMLKYILHKLPQPVLQKTQKTNIGLVSNQMRTARGPVDWQDTWLEHRGAQKEPVKKEKYKK